MIIGHGDLAQVLKEVDRENYTFFASGVSNSQCTEDKEYQREIQLLIKQERRKKLVYFSSLSIFYKQSRYTEHKLFMEEFIKDNFPDYCIIRLGNISWGNNPNTLINYLKAHPKAEIRDEIRYVILKGEFLHWINLIPKFNCEMNCPGQMLTIKQIYDEYVRIPKRKI